MAQRGKFANSSVLSQRVVSYLVKCLSYCITQNKGNPSALQKELKSIVPHAFGDHECCNESWCRAKQDPLNYKHSDLPYGKDLFRDQLQKSVQAIFDEYCTDLVVKKFPPAANSQRNEALNSIIGSKNPKIRFYGGSSSNDFRVACGISQAKLGHHYISQTLDSLKAGFHYRRSRRRSRSRSRHQKRKAIRSCENQTDGVGSRTLILLMIPSLTIK